MYGARVIAKMDVKFVDMEMADILAAEEMEAEVVQRLESAWPPWASARGLKWVDMNKYAKQIRTWMLWLKQGLPSTIEELRQQTRHVVLDNAWHVLIDFIQAYMGIADLNPDYKTPMTRVLRGDGLDAKTPRTRRARANLVARAMWDDADTTRFCLQFSDVDPITGITYAADSGRAEVVALLLKQINPVGTTTHWILVPSMNGDAEIVKLLLAHGRADPGLHGQALHESLKRGHVDVVAALLEDPRVTRFTNALSTAAGYNHVLVTRLLLTYDCFDPTYNNSECLFTAANNDNLEVLEILLADGRANPRHNGGECFRVAAMRGYTRIVRALMADARVDPSANNDVALRDASYYGQTAVVELLLLDDRVDPSANHDYSIEQAWHFDKFDIVRLLANDRRTDPKVRTRFMDLLFITGN